MVDCNGNSNRTNMGWNELFASVQVASNSRIFLILQLEFLYDVTAIALNLLYKGIFRLEKRIYH